MLTGILIIARAGSSRLSNKHFLNLCGAPILSYLIGRIQYEFTDELKQKKVELIIITGKSDPQNRLFEQFDIPVFYGNDNNIPLRQLEASEAFKLDNIISIDGDDILCSTTGMRQIYDSLTKIKNKYVCVTGLPLGMNVCGYSIDYLSHSLNNSSYQLLENGWGRIFNKNDLVTICMYSNNFVNNGDIASKFNIVYRFTLDYIDDFKFFAVIINELKESIYTINDDDLIEYVTQHKLYEINNHLSEEYWINYNKLVDMEVKNDFK